GSVRYIPPSGITQTSFGPLSGLPSYSCTTTVCVPSGAMDHNSVFSSQQAIHGVFHYPVVVLIREEQIAVLVATGAFRPAKLGGDGFQRGARRDRVRVTISICC